MANWSHLASEELYNVAAWGGGYFRVLENGHLAAFPAGGAREAVDEPCIDLHDLIAQIQARGVKLPILLRFDGILRARVRELWAAFNQARDEYGYSAPFQGVYPIKVNQQRHLVEALLDEGRKLGMGLEVGSKPELLAVLGTLSDEEALVVCNGYKDLEYVEMALLASKLGLRPVIVIEKDTEVELIVRACQKLGIRPRIGIRTKLSGIGSGRWKDSAGDRSKFGLTIRQIVQVVDRLREAELLDCLILLHYHIGSQITSIRSIKDAMREGTRTLVGLRQMGAPIEYYDVGGGLGVDYDGSNSNFESSMNYSLQEYANDVVYQLRHACEEAGIPEPIIVTESGRSLTAHHAVLVTDVLGVTDFREGGPPPRAEEAEPDLIHDIAEVSEGLNAKNYLESYHDGQQMREEATTLFNMGQLSLAHRARVDELFWRVCEKVLRITRALPYAPDDLAHLERDMADTYFLNFSLFQSMPDSWAINHLFPVLPIHRLNEEPSRRAILADITCDSDGKIDRFIDLRGVKPTLELHPIESDQPYLIGMFLIGAYQEILGDMHNLFGDTNVVHVDLGPSGRPVLNHVVRGDRVREVLSYVEYFENDLIAKLQRSIERALESDRLTFEESAMLQKHYEDGLAGYTYLAP